LYALSRLGFRSASQALIRWLEYRAKSCSQANSANYRMVSLDAAICRKSCSRIGKGYRTSFTVRVGNGAQKQCKLDIYGRNVGSMICTTKLRLGNDQVRVMAAVGAVDRLGCQTLGSTDEGIGRCGRGRQRYFIGRLMCVVAIDRGCDLPQKREICGQWPSDAG